jgi:hypothetical protein
VPTSKLFRALIGRVLAALAVTPFIALVIVMVIALVFVPAGNCASGSQAGVDILTPQAPEVAPKKYQLTVWVNVPHYKNCTETLTVFPYLSEVPKAFKAYGFNDTQYNRIKDSLVIQAFSAPMNERRPYPPQGWRFYYALNAAEREKGEWLPHTLVTIYPWVDRIYPVLRKYLAASNEAEAARFDRCDTFRKDYEERHIDLETDAMKAGLYPVEISPTVYHLSLRRAQVMLLPGNYWVTGWHKVIGLKYYWQEAVTIDENGPKAVELNEANALLIDGGSW